MVRSSSGERVVRWLLVRRLPVLLLFLSALALAASEVARVVLARGRLPVDNSLEIWFLENDPTLVRYREYQAEWGNDEAVVIGLFDPQGVLRPATLELIASLSRRLERLPHVVGVTSLATVHPIRADAAGDVVVDRFYRAPVAADDLAAIKARIEDDPLYREHLLAKDGKATVLSVQLETSHEFDRLRTAILSSVSQTLDDAVGTAGEGRSWAWGGIGVIHVALNQLVLGDSARFTLWTQLLLTLGLALVFRRALAVVACLLSVASAAALLVGLYLATGLSLNMITMVLPTLVMVVGLTDSVYFLMTFQEVRAQAPELSPREAVVQALGFCFWPGLFNSLTTAVGFLAFLSARMEVIRHLGVFAGVGVACAFVSSLLICTYLADRFPERLARGAGAAAGAATAGPALEWLAGLVVRRRRWLLCASALVAGLAALGISRLRVDSYSLGYFYEDHPIRRHDAALLGSIGPYLPLELVVRTRHPEDAKRPDVLRGIDALAEEVVREEPGVSRSISLASVARRLYQVLGDASGRELPDTRAACDQLLMFYDPDLPEDPVRLVDGAWRSTRLQFQIRNEGARAGGELLERIHARAARHLPADVELISGGYMPLYAKLIEYLVWGQVTSIVITTVVVVLLIALLFRSPGYALVALLPNALPVAATLGLMGFLGVRLDMATVMVSAIALGVAVDDTIHFLFKFRAVLDASGDPEAAMRETLTSTGRAIGATSLVVTLGFSVLCLARIKTIALFGAFLCVAMLAALAAEYFLTPALVLTFTPRRRSPPPSS